MEINIKVYDVKGANFPHYNWGIVPSEVEVVLQYIVKPPRIVVENI